MVRIFLLLLIFGCGRLFAQDINLQQSIDSAAIEYMRIVGNQSVLYYGNQQDAHLHTLNHPYLKDEQYAKARLSYCKVIYPEVLLRLDLYRDELIILSPERHSIVLFPENSDFAELHDYTIVYFRRDSLPGCPSSGYYILLHSGNCKVLEKQTATLKDRVESNRYEQYYDMTIRFYLYKDGLYHTIRNKRGLLKVLHPYKKELKRFISINQLHFRRDKETFISLTVREYEKLSGS